MSLFPSRIFIVILELLVKFPFVWTCLKFLLLKRAWINNSINCKHLELTCKWQSNKFLSTLYLRLSKFLIYNKWNFAIMVKQAKLLIIIKSNIIRYFASHAYLLNNLNSHKIFCYSIKYIIDVFKYHILNLIRKSCISLKLMEYY